MARVLAVDDDAAILLYISDAIESGGHSVYLATSAETATQALGNQSVDILVTWIPPATEVRVFGGLGTELAGARPAARDERVESARSSWSAWRPGGRIPPTLRFGLRSSSPRTSTREPCPGA